MSKQRCDNFNRSSRRKMRFGSDCSGADAAFVAAKQWATDPENVMMSEAPDAYAEVLFGLLNHPPTNYFKDVTRRGFSGPCFINGECIRAPSGLDMYSAGTVCKDFSSANQLNPKKFSGA
jgi:hypothetical protein|tara:strand:- start:309 stop:668 length:360 start_codon:yes stop_codon:yes gene_type:complete